MKQYTDIQLQELAIRLWHREKPLCQSSLVDSMLGSDDWSWEDVENLYPDPSDWDAVRCRAFLDDCSDRPLYWSDDEPEPWREAVLEYAEPAEILEWWAVSDWFADKLRAKGECILSNDHGTWWGRQCSGQSVTLDGVIQRIAVEVLT